MRRASALTLTALVLAGLLVFASPAPAGACTCVEVDDAVAFADADAVFLGRLSRMHPARDGGTVEVAILTVSDVFKGDVVREQAVVTPENSAACGVDFLGDETYLVFARADSAGDIELEDGFLRTEACAGTRIVDADTDLAFAGAPDPPEDAGPPTTDEIRAQLGDPRSSLFPELFIAGGVLVFVLGIAAWFSRKSRPAT